MEKRLPVNQLKRDARLLFGVKLNRDQKDIFTYYYDKLIEWQDKLNLFPPGAKAHLMTNYFLDSISLLKYLPAQESLRVIDIGSGNGCPGIPLKIAVSDLELILIESKHKRSLFLEKIKTDLAEVNISGITVLNERVENVKVEPKADWVVTRATYRLEDLLKLSQPLLKPNSYLIYYAGEDAKDQVKASHSSILNYGYQLKKVFSYKLPGQTSLRNLIILQFLGVESTA